MKKNSNNNLVTKSNRFIEARYKLTLTQQKILLKYISLVQPDDEDFKEHELSVKEIAEMIGRKDTSNLYAELKIMAKSFLSNPMLIPYEEGKGKGFHAYNWFSKFSYCSKEGKVILRSDPDLKPLLLNISGRFTKYRLKFVLQLKSSYSIRIYELCAQYKNCNGFTTAIDDLKLKIGLKITEYSRFPDFRKYVLDVATTEINEKTDISIAWEPLKTGRKFTKVKFTIKAKPKAIQSEQPTVSAPTEIFALIPEEHQPDCIAIANKIYEEAGEECLTGCIKYVLDAATRGEVSNFGAYMRSTYTEGYWEAFLAREKAQAQLEEARRIKEEAERQLREKQEQQARIEKQNFKRKRELVEKLKESYPEAYEELYQEAAREVGDIRVGQTPLINSTMRRMIEDFLKLKGLD